MLTEMERTFSNVYISMYYMYMYILCLWFKEPVSLETEYYNIKRYISSEHCSYRLCGNSYITKRAMRCLRGFTWLISLNYSISIDSHSKTSDNKSHST